MAGPVKNNEAQITNRKSWLINGDAIAASLGISRVRLINDFVAVGYGTLTLDHDKECLVLQEGVAQKNAPIACVGAGTGLGECFLTPDSQGTYTCFPTEAGHSEFSPRNDVSTVLFRLVLHSNFILVND